MLSSTLLDSRHRLTACEDLFRGTIDGASVHPREVVMEALQRNAAALILAPAHQGRVPLVLYGRGVRVKETRMPLSRDSCVVAVDARGRSDRIERPLVRPGSAARWQRWQTLAFERASKPSFHIEGSVRDLGIAAELAGL